MNAKKNIILFDGVCNLCNASVQFIIKKDKNHQFLFAYLQSDAAKNILLHKNSKKNEFFDLSTILLIQNDVIYTESTAILRVFKQLKLPYKLLYGFIIIPKFIRDFIYKWISKNRYKWFGKKEVCMVPSGDLLERFL